MSAPAVFDPQSVLAPIFAVIPMRGALIACFGAEPPASTQFERALEALRWHGGTAQEHHQGQLHAVCLVDPRDGPTAERGNGVISIVHGAAPSPVRTLEDAGLRFVALSCDGRVLQVSRDIFGEVPMFYRRFEESLWFSTEVHPLVALGDAAPDLPALAAYAATVEYPERTGWKGIHRVLPGEILTVASDLEMTSARYWEPEQPRNRVAASYENVLVRFRELFHEAVRRTLSGSDGVLMSGGLDSSAVALVAARVGRPELFFVTYPELPELDETRYASAVADAAGLPLRRIAGRIDRWDPTDDLETFGMPRVELPTGTFASALPEMAARGCEVALDGHDGDGALGNPHAELANAILDGRPWRLRDVAHRFGWPVVLRATVKELVPPSVRAAALRKPAERTTGDHYLPYFREPVHAQLLERYRWRTPREGWRREQYRVFLPPATQLIEESETLGARFGIDIRHPFADRELVTFLGGLPHAIKAFPGRSKPILRDGLADLLPDLLLDRVEKAEFSPLLDRRIDYEACFRAIRDSQIRLPFIDYGRLFRDASKPQNSRLLWSRLASVHLFVGGVGR